MVMKTMTMMMMMMMMMMIHDDDDSCSHDCDDDDDDDDGPDADPVAGPDVAGGDAGCFHFTAGRARS